MEGQTYIKFEILSMYHLSIQSISISFLTSKILGLCGAFCTCCLISETSGKLGKSGLLYNILGCFAPCIPILLLRQDARHRNNIEVRNESMVRKASLNFLKVVALLLLYSSIFTLNMYQASDLKTLIFNYLLGKLLRRLYMRLLLSWTCTLSSSKWSQLMDFNKINKLKNDS